MKILYVAGWARSGTTLLAEMAGALNGTLAVGELSGIWRAQRLDGPCSCGKLLSACPVWAPVLSRTLEAHPTESAESMEQLSLRVLKTRRSLELISLRWKSRETWPEDVRRYVPVMETLYHELARSAGSEILVDSSKLPPSFLIQHLMASVKTYVYHIYRDPRAVANSEVRTTQRSARDQSQLPRGKSAAVSAWYWTTSNLMLAALGLTAPNYRLLRYEDLVLAPAEHMQQIAEQMGTTRPAQLLDSGHIAVGNPARLGGASRSIKLDTSWRTELQPRDRAIVEVMTRPAGLVLSLLRYLLRQER